MGVSFRFDSVKHRVGHGRIGTQSTKQCHPVSERLRFLQLPTVAKVATGMSTRFYGLMLNNRLVTEVAHHATSLSDSGCKFCYWAVKSIKCVVNMGGFDGLQVRYR
jgi:hypothetical protein